MTDEKLSEEQQMFLTLLPTGIFDDLLAPWVDAPEIGSKADVRAVKKFEERFAERVGLEVDLSCMSVKTCPEKENRLTAGGRLFRSVRARHYLIIRGEELDDCYR